MKKKDVTHSILFQRVRELMLNHCTLGGRQRAICLRSWKTAYAVRRQESKTSVCCISRRSLRRALGLRRHDSFAAAGDVVVGDYVGGMSSWC